MPYDPDLGDDVSKVRLEIGDAGSSPELSDDFIEGVLATVEDDVLWAAEKCAWYLHARYARDVDRSEGGPGTIKTKTEYQSRSAMWRRIHDEIRARRSRRVAYPEVVGSDAQIEAAMNNPSIPRPTFVRGKFEAPGRNKWNRSWE